MEIPLTGPLGISRCIEVCGNVQFLILFQPGIMLTAAFFGAVIDFSLVVSSSAGAPASEADEEYWGFFSCGYLLSMSVMAISR
jgi:hypothetical protein